MSPMVGPEELQDALRLLDIRLRFFEKDRMDDTWAVGVERYGYRTRFLIEGCDGYPAATIADFADMHLAEREWRS